MATTCLLRAGRSVIRQGLPKTVSEASIVFIKLHSGCLRGPGLLSAVQQTNASQLTLHRYSSSFFTRLTAEELWSGVSGVSSAGKKRGRGKRGSAIRKIDLNRGQIIGEGSVNMVWPGLNAPVIKGRELVQREQLEPDLTRQDRIVQARGKVTGFRSFKLPPLQRGWTGSRFPGTSIGPPDPINEYTFEGFDTRVLEFKLVTNMTGNLGRKQRFSAFVVTGNKRGLAGYALSKAPNARAALRKAKNKAGQRLQHIELHNDHTVYHNFFTKEKQTAIMVKKRPKGSGLVCHRALKTICEVMGIKDLYAKVEGSTKNVQNLTKAFFNGLQTQETHEELANRTGLHLVEIRPEQDNLPVVVASPDPHNLRTTPVREEEYDFENMYFGGKVPYIKPKPKPFFQKIPPWYRKVRFMERNRNQRASQIERLALGLEPSIEEKKLRTRPLK